VALTLARLFQVRKRLHSRKRRNLQEGSGKAEPIANQHQPNTEQPTGRVEANHITPDDKSEMLFRYGLDLFTQSTEIHLDRVGDFNVLGFAHVTLIL
jgi:hypothetical protein